MRPDKHGYDLRHVRSQTRRCRDRARQRDPGDGLYAEAYRLDPLVTDAAQLLNIALVLH